MRLRGVTITPNPQSSRLLVVESHIEDDMASGGFYPNRYPDFCREYKPNDY
jgi:hypothetical protein